MILLCEVFERSSNKHVIVCNTPVDHVHQGHALTLSATAINLLCLVRPCAQVSLLACLFSAFFLKATGIRISIFALALVPCFLISDYLSTKVKGGIYTFCGLTRLIQRTITIPLIGACFKLGLASWSLVKYIEPPWFRCDFFLVWVPYGDCNRWHLAYDIILFECLLCVEFW